MVGFVSNYKNISVFSLYGNREKFSAQTTGLLFRNNHKMPRKKDENSDLFKKDVKHIINPFHTSTSKNSICQLLCFFRIFSGIDK